MGLLRYLLALSVLFSHCGNTSLLPANFAVESFYIISGFYMSLILNEKYTGINSYRIFITKRFFRLAPTYWTIALTTLIVCISYYLFSTPYPNNPLIFNPSHIIKNTSIETWIYAILSNIFMIGQDVALFFGVKSDNGCLYYTIHSYAEAHPFCRYFVVPQAWSLGLEFLFYIIAPCIVRRKKMIVCMILGVSLGIKIYIKYYLKIDDGNWTFRFFPSEIMFFCLGNISYKLYKRYNAKVILKHKYYLYPLVIGFTIIYMKMGLPFAIQYPLLIFVITILVFVLFSNYRNNKIDRIIGELSYPIYLSHSVIMMILYQFKNPYLLNVYIVAITTTLFSLGLYYGIIKPFEKVRNKM